MRISDPFQGIFQSGEVALRRIHEERIAALSFVGRARGRGLAENLKRLIVPEANDLGASTSDHISHPED